MNSAPIIQPHALMQKRSQAAGHDTAPTKGSNLSSAFADYLFGPLSSNQGMSQNGAPKASMALTNAKQSVEARR